MARHKRRHTIDSGNYWPGYVDALTNIVLNMVFLSGILVVAYFMQALGQIKLNEFDLQALNKVGKTDASINENSMDMVLFSALLSNGQLSEHQAKGTKLGEPVENKHAIEGGLLRIFQVRDLASTSVTVPARPQSVVFREEGQSTRVRIDFLGRESLDDSARQAMKAHHRGERASCACDYVVSASAALDDAQARRVAYLRVQEVRSTLLSLGVPSMRVKTHILTETRPEQSNMNVVNVVISPAVDSATN